MFFTLDKCLCLLYHINMALFVDVGTEGDPLYLNVDHVVEIHTFRNSVGQLITRIKVIDGTYCESKLDLQSVVTRLQTFTGSHGTESLMRRIKSDV